MSVKKSINNALVTPKWMDPIPRLGECICPASFDKLLKLLGIQPSTWLPDHNYLLVRPRCAVCVSDLSKFQLNCKACLREMFHTYDQCACVTCDKASSKYQKFLDQLVKRYSGLNFGDRYTLEWVVDRTKAILQNKAMEEIAKAERLNELIDSISQDIRKHSSRSFSARKDKLNATSEQLSSDAISSAKTQLRQELKEFLELNPVLKDDAKRSFPRIPLHKCRQIPYTGPDTKSDQTKRVSFLVHASVKLFDEDQLHPDTRDLKPSSRYGTFDFTDRLVLYKGYLKQLPQGQRISIEDWWALRMEEQLRMCPNWWNLFDEVDEIPDLYD